MPSVADLQRRLREPFEIAWPAVRHSSTISQWHHHDWQKRLWGVAWMMRNVFRQPLCLGLYVNGGVDERERQLRAMREGPTCDHETCHAWHSLYRRNRALFKVLPEPVAKGSVQTRNMRQSALLIALEARYGPSGGAIDDDMTRPSGLPGEIAEEL